MNLAEVKARHEALIKWSVFDGYTNEALIALVKTLHADRGWLIEQFEAALKPRTVVDALKDLLQAAEDYSAREKP